MYTLCDYVQVVKMIMEKQLQPVIVFSFSRRDCEAYALQMSKLDFNTGAFVSTVLFNLIQTLPSGDILEGFDLG